MPYTFGLAQFQSLHLGKADHVGCTLSHELVVLLSELDQSLVLVLSSSFFRDKETEAQTAAQRVLQNALTA